MLHSPCFSQFHIHPLFWKNSWVFLTNSSRNYLYPFLPSVSFSGVGEQGRNIRVEGSFIYTIFLFTKHLNNFLHKTQEHVTHWPREMLSVLLSCKLISGWPATHKNLLLLGYQKDLEQAWCREGQAGTGHQVVSNIRWCATKPKCVSCHVKDGKGPM